jgi:hypothetical protein
MKNDTRLLMVMAKGAKRIPMSVALAFALAFLHQDATANPIMIATGATVLNGGDTSSDGVWQFGSSVTLGNGTAFEGTMAAKSSIAVDTGATLLNGPLLGQRGGGSSPGAPSGGPVPDAVTALPLFGSALALIAMRRRISFTR